LRERSGPASTIRSWLITKHPRPSVTSAADRVGSIVAAAEAAKGKSAYQSDLETAKRAAGYYENVLDLTNAAFFLSEILRLDPSNTAAKSDLDKINAYEKSNK